MVEVKMERPRRQPGMGTDVLVEVEKRTLWLQHLLEHRTAVVEANMKMIFRAQYLEYTGFRWCSNSGHVQASAGIRYCRSVWNQHCWTALHRFPFPTRPHSWSWSTEYPLSRCGT